MSDDRPEWLEHMKRRIQTTDSLDTTKNADDRQPKYYYPMTTDHYPLSTMNSSVWLSSVNGNTGAFGHSPTGSTGNTSPAVSYSRFESGQSHYPPRTDHYLSIGDRVMKKRTIRNMLFLNIGVGIVVLGALTAIQRAKLTTYHHDLAVAEATVEAQEKLLDRALTAGAQLVQLHEMEPLYEDVPTGLLPGATAATRLEYIETYTIH